MKTQTTIIILIVVFAVIAAVVYMFLASNKNKNALTQTQENTGLANFFNLNPQVLANLFTKKTTPTA